MIQGRAWWLLASMAARAEGGSGWVNRRAGCNAPQEAWKAAGVSVGRGSSDSAGVAAGGAGAGMLKSLLSPSKSSSAETDEAGAAAGGALDNSEGPERAHINVLHTVVRYVNTLCLDGCRNALEQPWTLCTWRVAIGGGGVNEGLLLLV